MKLKTLLAVLLATSCGCDFPLGPPVTPEPEALPSPTSGGEDSGVDPSPLSACEAACARWEAAECKAGFAVCDDYDSHGDCVQYLTCEVACRRAPHAYPAAECVAKLAANLSTCEELEAYCGR